MLRLLVAAVYICLIAGLHAATLEIIANEDDITGSCTQTCGQMGTHYHKLGCDYLYGCSLNTHGWDRGFVRCDFCKCKCDKKNDDRDIKVSETWIDKTEPELYGTCTRTCDKSGLVRTNKYGCQEVRDCYRNRYGWKRWFVRCDHCRCKCVNRVRASRYELFDVKYDMSGASLNKEKPRAMARTYIENHDSTAQKISRTLSFQRSEQKSVSTTNSLETGLSISVKAGVTIKAVLNFETSLTRSITTGFTTTTGKSSTDVTTDSITTHATVDPHSKKEVVIYAKKLKMDVPFTGKIKRIYKDGSTKVETTKGVLSDVLVGDVRVTYGAKEAL